MIRYGWLCSLKPKVHQRAMNQIVRLINQNIKNDSLWRGRFVITQVGETLWHKYEDNSGGDLYVRLLLTDTVTGWTYYSDYHSVNFWRHWSAWRVWEFANDAIIKCREEFDF